MTSNPAIHERRRFDPFDDGNGARYSDDEPDAFLSSTGSTVRIDGIVSIAARRAASTPGAAGSGICEDSSVGGWRPAEGPAILARSQQHMSGRAAACGLVFYGSSIASVLATMSKW